MKNIMWVIIILIIGFSIGMIYGNSQGIDEGISDCENKITAYQDKVNNYFDSYCSGDCKARNIMGG